MQQKEEIKRGRPKGQQKTGGRQKGSSKDATAKTYRLAADVVVILSNTRNATAYIEQAVREKHQAT